MQNHQRGDVSTAVVTRRIPLKHNTSLYFQGNNTITIRHLRARLGSKYHCCSNGESPQPPYKIDAILIILISQVRKPREREVRNPPKTSQLKSGRAGTRTHGLAPESQLLSAKLSLRKMFPPKRRRGQDPREVRPAQWGGVHSAVSALSDSNHAGLIR